MTSFIRLHEVIRRTGLSRSTVYELAARGELPQQVKLSDHGRAVAWLESEIDAWLASRVAVRDQTGGAL